MRLSILSSRTHMTFWLTRRLKVLCTMFKIRAFFITALLTQLYERVDISITWGKHLLELIDRIISQRVEAWAHKTCHCLPKRLCQARKVGGYILCARTIDFVTFQRFFSLNCFEIIVFFSSQYAYRIWPSVLDSINIDI